MESTPYVFPFRWVIFYLVTTGWISDIRLVYVRIQSIEERTIERRAAASMGTEINAETQENETSVITPEKDNTSFANPNCKHMFTTSVIIYYPRILVRGDGSLLVFSRTNYIVVVRSKLGR